MNARFLISVLGGVLLATLTMGSALAADPPKKPAMLGVTIDQGPKDWQIVQRDKSGVADMTIGGTWLTTEKAFTVQGRVVDENTGEPIASYLDWQDAVIDVKAARFALTLKSIPQGGLYRIETRIRRPKAGDLRATRGDYIHHLGVGDIYIIAGQSNASGSAKGVANDGPMLGVALFGNDEQWKLATHPLEDARNTLHPITVHGVFHGHDPWMAFAKRILTRTGIPVALVPCAKGGSAILEWVTDTGKPAPLFLNMMDMFNKVGGKVAGVLWHQGESDCFQKVVPAYATRFRALVSLMRQEMGDPSLPIITGQLGAYASPPDPAMDEAFSQMREIQRSLAHEIPGVSMAVTLDVSYGDEIHNSAAANVTVGERYANLALARIYGKPTLADFPEPGKVIFTNDARSIISINFVNLAGDLTPAPRIDEFLVRDAKGVIPIKRVAMYNNREVRLTLKQAPEGPASVTALYGMRPSITLHDDSARCLTAFTIAVEEKPAEPVQP